MRASGRRQAAVAAILARPRAMRKSDPHHQAGVVSSGMTLPTARRLVAGLLALGTLAARAALAQDAERRPPLAVADIADIVTLTRIEDRREFDATALQRIAASRHPELRRRAAVSLARLYDARGRALLRAMRADSDTSVLATVAWATGQLVDTSAVPWLDSLLQDPQTPVGAAIEAAGAFGKIRTTETRAHLARYLSDVTPNYITAPVVAEALLSIGRHRERGDLAPIVRWAGVNDDELRWRAAWALFRQGNPEAIPYLMVLARDSSAEVRFWSVRGLLGPQADSAGVGAAAAQAVLFDALDDEDRRVRTEATRALGAYTTAESAINLTLLLGAEDIWLAVSAAEALGRRGDNARAAISQLVLSTAADNPLALRVAALTALGDVWLSAALEPATAMARDTSALVRRAAAQMLVRLRYGGRTALAPLRNDADAQVRAIAHRGHFLMADTLDDPTARRAARRAGFTSRDSQIRAAAALSMMEWADSSDIPVLLDAYAAGLADPSPDAAMAAVSVLAAIERRSGAAAPAFFARFRESPSDAMWVTVARAFGQKTVAAWGDGRPVRTHRTDADYRRIVETFVVPAYLGGEPPRLRWETTRGVIETDLHAGDAPMAADHLLQLAERRALDGVRFTRIVPNFVAQQEVVPTSPAPQRDEPSRRRLIRGNLSWGSSIGDRSPGAAYDTGPAVYTMGITPQPHNEGDFTALGQVVSGMDVVELLEYGDRVVRVTRVPPAPRGGG